MTFSVRQALADADLPPFQYEDAAGEQRTLPHAKMLSPEQAYRLMLQGDIGGVIEEIAPGQGESTAKMPAYVLNQLIDAWFEHSDVDLSAAGLGKPATPSPSGASTATRSKRTSRSGGSRSTR